MKHFFSEAEFMAARKLINISLANAAESFSGIARQNIQLKGIELDSIQHTSPEPICPPDSEDFYLLTTEIRGDMQAESYLMFTYQDAEELVRMCLHQEHVVMGEMEEALLLEIDNILSAAVVTQFSNFLDLHLFGYVPVIGRFRRQEVEKIIRSKIQAFDISFNFKTSFMAGTLRVMPKFIWIFGDHFHHAVQSLARNSQAMQLMHEKDAYVNKFVING